MSELRKDPIADRWVVIAPERRARPHTFGQAPGLTTAGEDPLLAGNEDATPPEILAYRGAGSEPNSPDWRVRVVPNKYPALRLDGEVERQRDGVYESISGVGAHEVIIECPHRETNMSRLSVRAIREVLSAYRDRLVDLKQDSRLAHAVIFKNQGAAAGASLDHSHSQLLAGPIVPPAVREELDRAQTYYQQNGRNIYDDIIDQELTAKERVVIDAPRFAVICPYASRFPFEIWIIPKRQESHYEDITQAEIDDLGGTLKQTLQRLELAADDPPYNYAIHSAPLHEGRLPHSSWRIAISPRITGVGGFEWGSGVFINTVAPEEAAQKLRAVEV